MRKIQWFPGHMAKARREVSEKLKLVDVIFELVDARLPLSSRNPMIDEIIQQKPRIVILNKADLADKRVTEEWLAYFEAREIAAVAINSAAGRGLNRLVGAAKGVVAEKFERMKAKGIRPRAIRAMIIGIPNVGKSTLINRLVKKNIAKTGNMPGVTKAQQWIKVGSELELLDTPGILWPKFEDEHVGLKLALTGAIKDTLLNLDDVALFALKSLHVLYPDRLRARYNFEFDKGDVIGAFDHIGRFYACLGSGGVIDYDRVSELIVKDVRNQQFGGISLEVPREDDNDGDSI